MSCLFCRNFQAIEPEEHRREREARTCEFSCGRDWDAYTAAFFVRRHKKTLSGFCHLAPTPAQVRCDGICSRFEDGFYQTWRIGQPEARTNIWDWAQAKMRTFVYGDGEEKENKRLTAENKTLKEALAAARKRSASRLVRLQTVAKKQQPKEPPKPPILHLVAAE